MGDNWNNSQEIISSNSYLIRNIIESCIIKKTFNENLNLSTGLFKLDNFVINQIVGQCPKAPP